MKPTGFVQVCAALSGNSPLVFGKKRYWRSFLMRLGLLRAVSVMALGTLAVPAVFAQDAGPDGVLASAQDSAGRGAPVLEMEFELVGAGGPYGGSGNADTPPVLSARDGDIPDGQEVLDV